MINLSERDKDILAYAGLSEELFKSSLTDRAIENDEMLFRISEIAWMIGKDTKTRINKLDALIKVKMEQIFRRHC